MFAVVAFKSAGIPLPEEATLIAACNFAAATQAPSLTSGFASASAGAVSGYDVGF